MRDIQYSTIILPVIIELLFLHNDFVTCRCSGHRFEDRCYLLNQVPMTYERALATCTHQYKAKIVSIRSQAEQDFLTDLVFSNYKSDENIWIGSGRISSDLNTFRWYDGWPFVYTAWDTHEPESKDSQLCTTMQNLPNPGKWHAAVCDHKLSSLCYKVIEDSDDNYNMTTIDSELGSANCKCPIGFFQYGSRCYTFDKSKKQTFDKSVLNCKDKYNGSLISVRTQDEGEFVTNLVYTAYGHASEAWLGAKRTGIGKDDWIWSDGTQFNYTNWQPGEPNYRGSVEYCATMLSGELTDTNKKWNDVTCSNSYASVCYTNVAAQCDRIARNLPIGRLLLKMLEKRIDMD